MAKIVPRMVKHAEKPRWRRILRSPISVYRRLSIRSRRYSYYHKLPAQLLKLSVLKLDGSSFCVHVPRNANVSELKVAVENVFNNSAEIEPQISWELVWGHFCLCHEGQKLINGKASLRSFKIKDGDEIQFIQHMSIDYRPQKQQPESQNVASRHFSIFLSRSSCREANANNHVDREIEESFNRYQEDEEKALVPEQDF